MLERAMLLRAMTECPWQAYTPATISFCEARVCGWVAEPSNAWSNLAYVIGGLMIWRLAKGRGSLRLIALASVLIGLGSFAFHGTGTRVGELVDVSAMYLLSCLGIVFSARRIWPLSTTRVVALYAACVAVSVALMIALRNNGIFLFAGQLAIGIAAEIHLYMTAARAPTYRNQQRMIASFTIAFAIWNADKWALLCAPDNHLVTGHAVWHVLTAFAVYFFARQHAQQL